MPSDRPDALELIEAVQTFLREQAAPNLDTRHGYHARVAANALDIALRELRQGPAMNTAEHDMLRALLSRNDTLDALNAALAGKIRAGELQDRRPELLRHLRQTAADKLAIANPRYRPRPK